MAQIRIKCPHCQSEMEGEEEWIGQEAACPFCQKNFVISRDPVRPTLVRPAVPPKSGKKIVFLIAGGAVVLLLAAGGAWFAFSGSSPTAERPKTAVRKPIETPAAKPVATPAVKPVETPAAKPEPVKSFKVPRLSVEINKENYDEIDFALIASELKKNPTTELKPRISDLLSKCRNHFIRNGDWKRYVQMVKAMGEVMPQETQRFSSEIDRESRELTERFHRSIASRFPEALREAFVEQLEQIDPQHPLVVKYRADQKQGIIPGAASAPTSGRPSGNPQQRPMPPVFQLRLAVSSGNVLLTKKLLESGVDPNPPFMNNQPKNRRLMTAALLCCKKASPSSPMRQKMIGCILLLQKHGVKFLPEEQSIAQTIPELSGE